MKVLITALLLLASCTAHAGVTPKFVVTYTGGDVTLDTVVQ